MPSPEFESKIQNVVGDVKVTDVNENLFPGFVKGIGLNASTGDEVQNNKNATTDFIKVNNSKTYYLTGISNAIRSFVAVYNKNKQFISRNAGGFFDSRIMDMSPKGSFPQNTNLDDNTIKYIRITQYASGDTESINVIDSLKVMLSEKESEDYIPHAEHTVTFPLAEGQRLMDGDYLAEDGVHHVRKQVELQAIVSLKEATIDRY